MAKHVVILTCISLLAGLPCLAATITVNWDGSGDYTTIQAGIDAAVDGDEVVVCEGTYTGPENRDIDFSEGLPEDETRAITVRSTDPCNPAVVAATVIDCQQNGRAFYFHTGEGPSSILSGFTITNGYVDNNDGGGIYCSGSSPTIKNCIIHNCLAGLYGGAIYCSESNPTITNCRFSNNSSKYGGGMFNNLSTPTLIDCKFNNNSADLLVNSGGGMHNNASELILVNCIFSGNSANNGAGMHNESSTATLTNCFFSGNSAIDGGGMINSDGSDTTLTNCVFSDNTANISGGGIYNSQSDLILANCTFSKNSSTSWGGGIHCASSEPILTNCILWGNTSNKGPQVALKYGSIGHFSYCDIQGGQAAIYRYQSTVDWGDGNINEDPLFRDTDGPDNVLGTEDDNLRLLPGSPCVDAGDNSTVPSEVLTDLDGNPRFADDPDTADTGNGTPPIVDMGAFEGTENGFVLSAESVTVPEGDTATFTVSILNDPNGTVDVSVAHQSGDTDVMVESGASLTFNSSNYSDPQTVTLAAAEDGDNFNGTALIWVSASGFLTVGVTAKEADNEPPPIILYVDASAQGANYGSSWTDAFTDLQEALSTAAMFPEVVEEIHVAQGVYRSAGHSGDREATFQLVNGVTIYGGFPLGGSQWEDRNPDIYETILSGDLNDDDEPNFVNNDENSYHVVTSDGADETAILDGFTITAGNANDSSLHNKGGGIHNLGGEFSGCTPTIRNCKVTKNWAHYGGGMFNWYTGIVIVGYGGPGPTLINCTFKSNMTDNDGGGICNYSTNPTMTSCAFHDNSAGDDGGGIFNVGSNPTLTNATFSGNLANINGGAMINIDCQPGPIVTNCTFSENSAGQDGGGLYSWLCGPMLTNCILWDNSDSGGTDESAQIHNSFSTPVVNYCCVQGLTGSLGGTGNIGDAPCFADVGANDFHLQSEAGRWDSNGENWVIDDVTSPCIDAGDPCSDYSGEPWPHGHRVNMGAYGNTPDASRSCTNIDDVRLMGTDWLHSDSVTDIMPFPDGDGIVDLRDYAFLALHWLCQEQ